MDLCHCIGINYCHGNSYFLIQPTRVSGESMEDTLHNGQYLIVTKWHHIMNEMPNYGQIVIIDSRVNRARTWVDDVEDH